MDKLLLYGGIAAAVYFLFIKEEDEVELVEPVVGPATGAPPQEFTLRQAGQEDFARKAWTGLQPD